MNEIVKPNTQRRIPGEGLPHPKETSKKGDLIVNFDIKFPDFLTEPTRQIMYDVLPVKWIINQSIACVSLQLDSFFSLHHFSTNSILLLSFDWTTIFSAILREFSGVCRYGYSCWLVSKCYTVATGTTLPKTYHGKAVPVPYRSSYSKNSLLLLIICYFSIVTFFSCTILYIVWQKGVSTVSPLGVTPPWRRLLLRGVLPINYRQKHRTMGCQPSWDLLTTVATGNCNRTKPQMDYRYG